MPDWKRLSQSVPKHNGHLRFLISWRKLKFEGWFSWEISEAEKREGDVMYMSPCPLISQQDKDIIAALLCSSLGESQFKTSNERTIEKDIKRHWHRNGKNIWLERKRECHREREKAFQVDRDKVRDNDRIQTLERCVCVCVCGVGADIHHHRSGVWL